MKTVNFTAMKDGTRAEYEFLREQEDAFFSHTADRLLRELGSQAQETIGGYKVTRLDHALQSAARAEREGADTDWVVAALLHDIGDGLAPQNHDRMAAEILRPFVREEVTWVVEHHGAFQMVYYAHYYEGWNQFEREKYSGHPYYQSCIDFCERWDQSSFDPNYDTPPLSHFESRVQEVFARKPYSPEIIKEGTVIGLPPLPAPA
ncbi:peptidase [Chromatiales bacterium (ex Bugula neritina AB1)]|nr:peptidase [Chromatiales bacterium (ex Bugula neritina AB1)]